MPTFDSLKQLKKYVDEVLQDVAENEVKKEVITTIKEHIDSDVNNVYDPNPDTYRRKHYLENSLDGKIESTSSGLELTVEHDESKMHYNSVVSGNEVDGNAVAWWVEHGYIYPLWGTEGVDGKEFTFLNPRPYMKNSYNELKDKNVIPHVVKKALKKRKIDSEVL
jgi:hypothetical protein